jgi:hypothetical protein
MERVHLPDASYTNYGEIPSKGPIYPICSKDFNNAIQAKERYRADLMVSDEFSL